jgi:hypothetical protein
MGKSDKRKFLHKNDKIDKLLCVHQIEKSFSMFIYSWHKFEMCCTHWDQRNLLDGIERFQAFLFLQIRDKPEALKKIQKTYNWTQNQRHHEYCGFRKIPCCVFPDPLNWGIFIIFRRFIEDYLRKLTCCEQFKNRFRLSAPKLTKNRWGKIVLDMCFLLLF